MWKLRRVWKLFALALHKVFVNFMQERMIDMMYAQVYHAACLHTQCTSHTSLQPHLLLMMRS
jgi:hypothetical protein